MQTSWIYKLAGCVGESYCFGNGCLGCLTLQVLDTARSILKLWNQVREIGFYVHVKCTDVVRIMFIFILSILIDYSVDLYTWMNNLNNFILNIGCELFCHVL